MMNDTNLDEPPAKKPWGWIIAFGLFVAICIFDLIDSKLHPQTPEQIQARMEQVKAEADHRSFLAALCHQEAVCDRYGTARQECATAGNYDNCIRVKLGYQDASTVDACTEDGKLAFRPADMPDPATCWIREKLRSK